jgi:predicted DNA-binding protein YlxM (UPF0122 family)
MNGSKSGKDPATLIRKALFNYELEMARADALAQKFEAKADLHSHPKGKREKREYVLACVQRDKYEQYRDCLSSEREELLETVNSIVDKYQGRWAEIFEMAFLERTVSLTEISDKTHYSKRTLSRIIKIMRDDLQEMETKKYQEAKK